MKNLQEEFSQKGWVVIDFIDPTPVQRAKELLQKQLDRTLGRPVPLEEYHTAGLDDSLHTELQISFTSFFRENKLGKLIIEAQKVLFQQLIGLDLKVQTNPYLRITRPFKKQDNIGYHRDTFYGGSPYELSVLIPFVDLPPESSLSVMSGSHIFSESLFPTKQIQSEEVQKGSSKHNLGFLYAPKLMDDSIEKQMEPIALKVGQALVFSLSTVHGSVENRGNVTRWSTDIRVMNAFAPVDLSARPNYYEPLCASAVSESASKYFMANESIHV